MKVQLREYQKKLAAAIGQAFEAGHRRVVGYLPTGGGKTEIAMGLIGEALEAGGRALVLVERKVLATQWAGRLEGVGFVPGVLQGENTRRTWAMVLVATAQTVRTRGIPEGCTLIVIDESHIWHRTHDDVLEAYPDVQVVGLTATPLREGLGLRFDTLVCGALIGELQRDGWLVPGRYFSPNIDAVRQALDEVHVVAGDFRADELSRAMRAKAIVGDVVGTWLKRGENRQTIAFCVDKAHAHELAEQFVLSGVAATSITEDTEDEERAELFSSFDTGAVRVLCSVAVLSVGFDSPAASCVILARPTLSLTLHLQQIGRGLRRYPGKTDCLVFDHAMNVLRHGRAEDFVPPNALDEVDRTSDKKKRTEYSDVVMCRNCDALYPRTEECCPDCGTSRVRHTAVVVLDGTLQSVDLDERPEAEQAPPEERVREVYRMLMHHANHRGFKRGWAYFNTLKYFRLRENTGLPKSWALADPIPVDAEVARWLDGQRKRSVIARRAEGRRAASQKLPLARTGAPASLSGGFLPVD